MTGIEIEAFARVAAQERERCFRLIAAQLVKNTPSATDPNLWAVSPLVDFYCHSEEQATAETILALQRLVAP